MSEFEKFSFVIPAYSPETMPLDRLIEYLQQISVMIGNSANLHLVEIQKSSTSPMFIVPKREALIAIENIAKFKRGDGTREQARAHIRIGRMVRRDAPGGRRPATLRSTASVILEIPAAPDDLGVLTGVRQTTTFDGVLISLGGVGDSAAVRLQSLDGQVVSGFTATRSVAKDLAKLIYEPIRVGGPGVWGRTEDGVWALEKMQIQSFERIEDEPFGEMLVRLRSVEFEWPQNAIELINFQREGTA